MFPSWTSNIYTLYYLKHFASWIDEVLNTNLLIWETNTATDGNVFLTDDDIVFIRKNETTKIFQSGKVYVIKIGKSFANENILEQGFPTWGTFTPRGAFAYPKGCILRLSIEEQNIFEYDLFRNIYTYINEYSFQKSLYAFQKIIIFQFRFNINELLSVTCVGKSAVNRWNEATSRQTQIFLFYFARFVYPLRCLRVEMIQAKRFS